VDLTAKVAQGEEASREWFAVVLATSKEADELKTERFAVIGSGAAGLAAAWRLHRTGHVTLYERDRRLGGHAWTMSVPDGPDAGLRLDIAFMIMNDRRYPTMSAILASLPDVELAESDMSFSYTCRRTGHSYAINHARASMGRAEPACARVRHARLVSDALRFSRIAQHDLTHDRIDTFTLGEYLEQRNIDRVLRETYLIPMAAALWSVPPNKVLDFPAERYLRFLEQHGLLALDEPFTWRHVVGGSQRYVQALIEQMAGIEIRMQAPVWRVEPANDTVGVFAADGSVAHYDGVVIAAHADEASALLDGKQAHEKSWLDAIGFQTNEAIVHWDETVMPPDEGCWAAWNYEREPSEHGNRGSITYYLNALQGHADAARDYFVTLNRSTGIDPSKVLLRTQFRHPVFDFAAVRAQRALRELPRASRIRFAGSYLGHGFHEDAMASGVKAAQALLEI
jgi:hypothetical protein